MVHPSGEPGAKTPMGPELSPSSGASGWGGGGGRMMSLFLNESSGWSVQLVSCNGFMFSSGNASLWVDRIQFKTSFALKEARGSVHISQETRGSQGQWCTPWNRKKAKRWHNNKQWKDQRRRITSLLILSSSLTPCLYIHKHFFLFVNTNRGIEKDLNGWKTPYQLQTWQENWARCQC